VGTICRIPESFAPRTEDPPLLRGQALFVDDLRVGQLHAVFVRSPMAAAHIAGIDVAPAVTAPGVVGVFTAADLALAPVPAHPMLPSTFDRPPLATGTANFVGDPVAVVVADTRAHAADAADLVALDLAPLRVVTEATGSSALAYERGEGTETEVLAGVDLVVEVATVNQRVAPAPMEPDGALAVPTTDGAAPAITVWASTQRVHQVRDAVAAALGLPLDEVRVVAPQVGGGFGGKFEAAAETIVVAALARRLGRAVAWVQTRSENLVAMPHGRGQHQRGALGLRADGTFVGIWVDLLGDAGAYPSWARSSRTRPCSWHPGPTRSRARVAGGGRRSPTPHR
jgi:carbon-monoxide dehydrogenase large subunit